MQAPLSPAHRFRQQRRTLLSRHAEQCGIEFVQAEKGGKAWILKVYFVPVDALAAPGKRAVPANLQARDFHIARLNGAGPVPQIGTVTYPPAEENLVVLHLASVPPEDENSDANIAYVLHLDHSRRVNPAFAHALFSLRSDADIDLPSFPSAAEATQSAEAAEIHYLAKDYQSFCTLLFDHLSLTLPGWRERHAADLGVALVELLAYAGDYLSYYQDAVGTESYLGTARRRISLRRHARLLDYRVGEGCNARAWMQLEVQGDGVPLPAGTAFTTASAREHAAPTAASLPQSQPVFESMHEAVLWRAHNAMPIYCWGVHEFSLEPGATGAALEGHFPQLHAGDILILEETRHPLTGQHRTADPQHRHAVRLLAAPVRTTDALTNTPVTLIAWGAADALPFRLVVAGRLASGKFETGLAVACGNVVLADHGETLRPVILPGELTAKRLASPISGIVWAAPYQHKVACSQPAAAALEPSVDESLPCLKLMEWRRGSVNRLHLWQPQPDLLSSDRYARDFVAEVESDGQLFVRFGDDASGRSRPSDAILTATARVGREPDGNVAADTLVRLVRVRPEIVSLRNPLPARHAVPPETAEHVRLHAVEELRLPRHCVTLPDYAAAACEHPEVRLAAARWAWTGSERLVSIYVARRGGRAVSSTFRQRLAQFLESRRLVGAAFEIRPAPQVSLFLALRVGLHPGHSWNAVRSALARVLSDQVFEDGTRGFFCPDAFSFGQTVYLSEVVACASAVPGVARLNVQAFQRWRRDAAPEVEEFIKVRELELPRLTNDHTQPQHGILSLHLEPRG